MSNSNNRILRNGVEGAPSIIGPDVKIAGNIETLGEIQLEGIVEGDVNCGSMTMGEHGEILGNVSADSLVIRGRVDGSIRARSVRLESSAKVSGEVRHETLSVESGARIEGRLAHIDSPEQVPAQRINEQQNIPDNRDDVVKPIKGDGTPKIYA